MTVVFLHGAGAAGPAAWPRQAAQLEPGWVFLDRAPDGDHAARDAQRILHVLADSGPGHVVATSYGGNAAVIAAQLRPDLVTTLALFEPACFDLARGKPAVEEHIAALDPVYELADDPSVSAREFSRRFSAAMGTEPPDLDDDELESAVTRLRRLVPPWRTGISPDAGIAPPVLVVTGGSGPLYDQTAKALVSLGAEHVELPGAGHGVHKDPRSDAVLRAFWERADGTPGAGVDGA